MTYGSASTMASTHAQDATKIIIKNWVPKLPGYVPLVPEAGTSRKNGSMAGHASRTNAGVMARRRATSAGSRALIAQSIMPTHANTAGRIMSKVTRSRTSGSVMVAMKLTWDGNIRSKTALMHVGTKDQ